jgi:hypothetical protein
MLRCKPLRTLSVASCTAVVAQQKLCMPLTGGSLATLRCTWGRHATTQGTGVFLCGVPVCLNLEQLRSLNSMLDDFEQWLLGVHWMCWLHVIDLLVPQM